jgi:glycogen(starch) synthase
MSGAAGSRPPRLLMTADAVGGVWTYVQALLTALAGRIECVLAIIGPGPDAAALRALDNACATSRLSIEHRPYPLEWMPGGIDGLPHVRRWMAELSATFKPDVVHLNGFAYGSADLRAPMLIVAHSCVRTWWRAVKGSGAPCAWDEYSREVRRGLAAASLVVAPTAAMLDGLRREYSFEGPAWTIANGLPGPLPLSRDREPLIFAAGRVDDEAKGIRVLEQAAGGLPWPLVIAGGTAVSGQVSQSGTTPRYLGRVDRSVVMAWMNRAAIYAWPAIYEPFGLSVLEAAQRGCALVLSDIPSLRELWDEAALFVEPGSVAAWRAALDALASDANRMNRLSRAAHDRARQYTSHIMSARYLDAYTALLGRSETVACAS